MTALSWARVKARRAVVAKLVAAPLTILVLWQVAGPASSDPAFDGCGEHRGLVIATGTDASLEGQRNKLMNNWNSTHGPAQQVTTVEVGPSIDLLHSQVARAAQSRSCAYDVLVLDTPWTAEFGERHLIEPVRDAWMADPGDIFTEVLETGRWRGVQYAVPWTTDVGLLYLQPTAQVPASWRELLSAGYATQLADYEGLTVNALEVIWNIVGSPILSGSVESVDDKTAQRVLLALDQLARAIDKVPGVRTWDETGTIEAFAGPADRRPPLMRNWPYVFRALTADPRIRSDFAVRPLPSPSYSVLGGQNLAVSTFSKHKDDAGRLVNFLTDRRAEIQLFACGGYPPTRPSALGGTCTDPTSTPDPEDVPDPQRMEQFATTLKGALLNAHPRPATPYYGQFSETFRECVNKVLDGKPPTAGELADALNAALEGRHDSC